MTPTHTAATVARWCRRTRTRPRPAPTRFRSRRLEVGGADAVTTIAIVVTKLRPIPPPARRMPCTVTRTAPLANGWQKVNAGWRHTCGIRMDGTAECWHFPVTQEGGFGHVLSHGRLKGSSFHEPQTLGVVQEIDCGRDSVVRPADSDGEVRCWGKHITGTMMATTQSLIGTGSSTRQSEAGPQVDLHTIYNGCRLLADGSADCPGAQPPNQSLRIGPYHSHRRRQMEQLCHRRGEPRQVLG